MSTRNLFILVMVILFAACSPVSREADRVLQSPIDIESTVSDETNFSQFTTWSWIPGAEHIRIDRRLEDADTPSRIAAMVESHMYSRGFKRTDTAPDLVMNFHLAINDIDESTIEEFYSGGDMPKYRANFSGPKKVEKEWKEGSLILFMFDTKTGQLVWQASAQAEVTLEEVPQDIRDKRLKAIVDEMFEKLPKKSS